MVAMLAALLFAAAFAASVWSIWITVAPRIAYMRTLLVGDHVRPLPAMVTRRDRAVRAVPAAMPGLRAVRIAA